MWAAVYRLNAPSVPPPLSQWQPALAEQCVGLLLVVAVMRSPQVQQFASSELCVDLLLVIVVAVMLAPPQQLLPHSREKLTGRHCRPASWGEAGGTARRAEQKG